MDGCAVRPNENSTNWQCLNMLSAPLRFPCIDPPTVSVLKIYDSPYIIIEKGVRFIDKLYVNSIYFQTADDDEKSPMDKNVTI